MSNFPRDNRQLTPIQCPNMHIPSISKPTWPQRPNTQIPPPPKPPNFAPPPFFPSVPFQYPPYTFQGGFHQGSFQKASSLQTKSTSTDIVLSNCKSQDQDLIEKWLKKRYQPQIPKASNTNTVKINELREKLNIAFQLIKELENGARTLGVMAKTVSSVEWEEKCKEIEEKKKKLSIILTHLQLNQKELKSFKERLHKRSKKRERLKRQAKKRKLLKEEQRELIRNHNIQIDNWQKEMQENVEKVKQEEELQKEADAVLWGVTQKKSEVRRQISLLSALLELRHVRVKRLTAAGQNVSQTQIESFNTVIEMLKKSWIKHLDECALEEHALRGMLTKAEIRDDPVKRYKKLVLLEWEMAIFGSSGNPVSNIKANELLEVRESWDRFIVSDDTVLSSSIPSGWVLPTPPSSEDWHKLLKY